MARKEKDTQSKLMLSSQALNDLGISKQPFASSILSDKEVYIDSTLSKLIDSIKHHIQFSPLLLIIEGEFGSGKTTLFRHFSQIEVDNVKLLPVQAEASDTLIQIQHKMSFHLEDIGSANHLDDNLKQLATFDTIPALVIDNAHTLSDTVIQEIIRYKSTLKQTHEVELKILLIANPGMSETIEKITDLDHNQLYVQNMPVFNEKQILNFCQHRLLTAGYTGQPVLDSNNAQQILKKSNGIPLQILETSTGAIEKNLKAKNKSTGSLTGKLIPLVVILIILSGIGYYLLQPDQSTTTVTQLAPATIQPEPQITIPEQKIEPGIEQQVKAVEPETTIVTDTSEVKTEIPAEEVIRQEISSLMTEAPAVPAQPETPAAPAPAAQAASPESPAEPPVAETVKKQSTVNLTLATTQTEIPEPAISQQAETRPEPVTKKTSPQPGTTGPGISPHPALTALGEMGIHDREWLLEQKASHWTLQILGARDPETLLKFAKQHKLGNDSAWYETQLSGKPWYVMVHRFYTSKDVARTSITRLPAALQKSRPWVKSVGSIHQALK